LLLHKKITGGLPDNENQKGGAHGKNIFCSRDDRMLVACRVVVLEMGHRLLPL